MKMSLAVEYDNTEAIYVLLMSCNSIDLPENYHYSLTQIVIPPNITEIREHYFFRSYRYDLQ